MASESETSSEGDIKGLLKRISSKLQFEEYASKVFSSIRSHKRYVGGKVGKLKLAVEAARIRILIQFDSKGDPTVRYTTCCFEDFSKDGKIVLCRLISFSGGSLCLREDDYMDSINRILRDVVYMELIRTPLKDMSLKEFRKKVWLITIAEKASIDCFDEIGEEANKRPLYYRVSRLSKPLVVSSYPFSTDWFGEEDLLQGISEER